MSLLDVAPTVLRWLGVTPPAESPMEVEDARLIPGPQEPQSWGEGDIQSVTRRGARPTFGVCATDRPATAYGVGMPLRTARYSRNRPRAAFRRWISMSGA